MKKVYRKVAKVHHKKVVIRKVSDSKKNKDFGQLLEMADELEIDIELSNELIDEMTNNVMRL